jgi:dTDP-glucose pyrophosphorylase
MISPASNQGSEPEADLALVMPMAGRGSRFSKGGEFQPKPLIDLAGRPFFWWAIESVRRSAALREIVCVVLEEHVSTFDIDARILEYYPKARIVVIPEVTHGAAETAQIGIKALTTTGPVAINDSDHAFRADLAPLIGALQRDLDAALLCFASSNPAYSYVLTDEAGRVTGTAEKRVVGPHAIAGCYFFAQPARFLALFDRYRESCSYDELFVSGLYDALIADGGTVGKLLAQQHVSFGTPNELACVDVAALAMMHLGAGS